MEFSRLKLTPPETLIDSAPMSDQSSQNFYVCVDNARVYVKASMSATHLYAPHVTGFISSVIEEKKVDAIVLDLSETTYMDSTFLGSIMLIHQENEESAIDFSVVNPTPKAYTHLETTGLHEILKIEKDISLPAETEFKRLDQRKLSSLEKEELMLDAHETLSAINDKNANQFALLNKTLRDDIDRKKAKEADSNSN